MKMNLRGAQVKVTSHFHIAGSALKGTLASRCTGFDLQMSLETDEDEEQVRRLIQVAHNSCFTEAALERPVPIRRTHVVNGRPFDVECADAPASK